MSGLESTTDTPMEQRYIMKTKFDILDFEFERIRTLFTDGYIDEGSYRDMWDSLVDALRIALDNKEVEENDDFDYDTQNEEGKEYKGWKEYIESQEGEETRL